MSETPYDYRNSMKKVGDFIRPLLPKGKANINFKKVNTYTVLIGYYPTGVTASDFSHILPKRVTSKLEVMLEEPKYVIFTSRRWTSFGHGHMGFTSIRCESMLALHNLNSLF